MDEHRHGLAALVGDVGTFATDHWGRAPMLRRSVGPPPLLTLDDVDAWLAAGARRPAFRVVDSGSTLDSAASVRTVRVGGRSVDDVADPTAIAGLLAGGATLVAQNLELALAAVATFVAELVDDLSHPVQANAYLTPPWSHGLGRHRDTHDVFVIQLEGTKRWDVEGLGDVELGVGDVLYLPTGTAHDASTTDRTSLHLTIGVLRVTVRQVAQRLLGRRGEDDPLDDPLPIGFAHAPCALAAWLAERLSVLGAGVPISEVVADEIRRVRGARPADRRGAVATMARRLELTDLSMIRLADVAEVLDGADLDGAHLDGAHPDGAHLAGAHPDGARPAGTCVRLPDRVLELPPAAGEALAQLASRHPVAVGELRGLTPASRLVVARRLVREGAVDLVGVSA